MTAPLPVVGLQASNPEDGCAAGRCGRRDTVQLHPYRGRLCPAHAQLPTVPPGPYRPDFAAELVELGRADAAFGYLRAFLRVEADRRYAAAAGAL